MIVVFVRENARRIFIYFNFSTFFICAINVTHIDTPNEEKKLNMNKVKAKFLSNLILIMELAAFGHLELFVLAVAFLARDQPTVLEELVENEVADGESYYEDGEIVDPDFVHVLPEGFLVSDGNLG
jgi:hypothetical protein